MRDSPSIEIVNELINEGANINIYDPSFSTQAKRMFNNVAWKESVNDACEGADTVIILTDWPEFKALNLKELRSKTNGGLLIDLRNIYPVK